MADSVSRPDNRVTRIQVAAERPYEVVVGHGVLGEVTDVLGTPRRVAVLHPAALIEVAVRVAASLERAGHEVVRIDVPDAEAAKTVEVAARCWSVLGNAGFTRSDAVVGVGGLGHMGVKIAAAMGATVTTISRSMAKADDAEALGATRHIASSDSDAMKAARGSFDIVLNTVSADIPMADYVRLLKPAGVVVNVGLPPAPYKIPPGSLIGGNKAVAGSQIGGIAETQEMLDFCAEHGIAAEVEVIGADQVNEAYERVLASDVRYRFVIDTSTLG